MKKTSLSIIALSLLVTTGCGSAISEETPNKVNVDVQVTSEKAKTPAVETMETSEKTKTPAVKTTEVMIKSSAQEVKVDTETENKSAFVITGNSFAFSQKEMRVKKGSLVTVTFTSTGGFHDWVVDEFNAATKQVKDGEGSTTVTFKADKTGTFEYYCSVGSHRAMGMVGNLIVE